MARYAATRRLESSRDLWMRRSIGSLATMAMLLAIALIVLRPVPVPPALRRDAPLVVVLLREQPPPPPPRPVVPRRPPRPVQPRLVAADPGRRSPPRVSHISPSPATTQLATADPLDITLERNAFPTAPAIIGGSPAPAADPTGVPAPVGSGVGVSSGRGGSGDGKGIGVGTGLHKGVVLAKPDWVIKPSDMALRAFWPADAAKTHQSGASAIACRVQLSTRVHDCQLIGESPAGLGFGSAAIAASQIFRVHPPRRNGRPIDEAWVAVMVVWTNHDPPPKARGKPKQDVPAASTPPAPPAG